MNYQDSDIKDIKDFNYGLVDEVANGTDIVKVLTYMNRFLRHNATRMNFDPTTWAITMRPELFFEITAVWPCSYLTYRRIFWDAIDQINLRDTMRGGSYLLIDGIQVPVIQDDGITEETDADNVNILAGQFASDIYFIPLTIRGGQTVTFMPQLAGRLQNVRYAPLQHTYTSNTPDHWIESEELKGMIEGEGA